MHDIFGLLEHLPTPTYVFRLVEGRFLLLAANARARADNPTLVSFYGAPMDHLYRDQPHALADAEKCMREGGPVVREMTLRRYDRLEANERVRLVFTRHEPDLLMIALERLPTLTLAEAALREAEERYRSLVASLPDAVILRGLDGRVLACNEVAANMCGRSGIADMLGRVDILAEGISMATPSGAALRPEDLPSRRVLVTNEPALGQTYVMHREGRPARWYRVSAQVVRTSDGSVAGSVTIYADDTERIEAERAVAESAARLSMALDAARMGTWEWEPSIDRGYWSPTMPELFKLPPLEAGLAAFLALIHPDDRGVFTQIAEQISEARDGEVFEHEWRVLGVDGVTRWARSRGRIENRGGAVRLSGTVLDVTERRALEEELRRAHRLESIGRLAGGLAHDFNNLLAAMLGSIELLEDVVPEAGREDLATVRHGAERARELTAQLLAFARKQPVALTVFDLSQAVTNVERLLRRLVGPRIDLTLRAERGAWIHADGAQIEQVLVNLVANARDAMPGGGPLTVTIAASPSTVTLVVEDRGSGMDEHTRAHAFDPFFTTKSAGTGLGLASSYGIVQQHGGDIEIESTPGQGTSFRVRLPRAEPPVDSAVAAAPATRASAGTILVVDDEPAVRRTAARVLGSLGYEVLVAAHGDEAVALARSHPKAIDAVLCDVAMPSQSGPEVVAALRQVRPALRVLFVSGYSDNEASVADAHTAFLAKPYTRADLAARLHGLLQA